MTTKERKKKLAATLMHPPQNQNPQCPNAQPMQACAESLGQIADRQVLGMEVQG